MPDDCLNDCPCETLWLKNPAVLLKLKFQVENLCESENLNAFTRACLLGLLIGSLLSPMLGIGAFAIILLILIFLYHRWLFAKVMKPQKTVVKNDKKGKPKEGFEGAPVRNDLRDELAFPIMTSPGATVVTKPTARNPFMNVLLDEISYNPRRPGADIIMQPMNQIILDDYFRVQWTSDPTDVFGRTQGQRQFYTMPSSSIPNDQGSYQNWLYLLPGKTCKEGGRDACVPGTQGAPIPWLNKPN